MSITIDKNTRIILEESALKGVKRVAGYLAQDMEKVFGGKITITGPEEGMEAAQSRVFIATLSYTKLIDDIDVSDIKGKREVYKYLEKDGNLYIIGSDKRGSIYGLFHLSELMGVSVFVDWFDLYPVRKEQFVIEEKDLITSKEPSVRYRGFFINDEWPAFGNWCNKNFGGFNAKAYEGIFKLLLRMKGNLLWPAMWSAIFPEDGPGSLNEELADELGVVMGMSHHEPCLRQGEEYKYLRGKDSIYGDAWNFRTNEEGISRFWEDGLKRSGRYENVITVGMRGEADTAIMGKDASLKDNIELLRDVLRTQNRLIRENVNEDLDKVPRMLALYKEVEPYFYGDDTTDGLMDSEELDGVTLLLCDDNFGNLRTLPTKDMQNHRGGYGMYYHFDYHGLPVSYEWVNSSYLPKVWEQMTLGYESGIRELWIVNVGDLFSMEYPLSFFLDMAYDYDKWGINNINSGLEYSRYFIEKNFVNQVDEDTIGTINRILNGYTRIAHKRRPEAMNSEVYSPVWYGESDELLREIDELEEMCDELKDSIYSSDSRLYFPFFSLVYYPAMANLNVQKLWLLAGKNHYYAAMGAGIASKYADGVESCLDIDEKLVDELHSICDGRFYGMGLSEHIGFKNWCEEECQYPVLHSFKRGNKARIIVSIPGSNQHSEGGDWTKKTLVLGDFLWPEKSEAYIELLSAGVRAGYELLADDDYLIIDEATGVLEADSSKLVRVRFDRERFIKAEQGNGYDIGIIRVKTDVGQVKIKVPVCALSTEEIRCHTGNNCYVWLGSKKVDEESYSPYQYIAMEAAGYDRLITAVVNDRKAEFREIEGYGKTLSAMKAFPVDEVYDINNAPGLSYKFEIKREGSYIISAYLNPSNAPFKDGHLYYGISINDGEIIKLDALPEGYQVEDGNPDFSRGVLDNIRIASSKHSLKAGINQVCFYALSPGFVLERVLIFEEGREPAKSYLGPKETLRL